MRQQKYKVYIDIFLYIILAVSVVLAFLFYRSIGQANETSTLNLFMGWSYILIGIGALVAFVISPIFGVLTNPKTLVKSLISLGVLLIVILISYSLSSTTPVDVSVKIENMERALRLADTSLYAMYILGALGFLAIIASEIRNMLQ